MEKIKNYLYELATDQRNGTIAFVLKAMLLLLSWAYCLAVKIRFALQRKYVLPSPVISVGNITLGGSGKTPLVELLARMIKERGAKPVILTRGYMADKNLAATENSDEAQMLRNSLKDVDVLVGADRFQTAQKYLAENKAGVFVLDDGFQHLKLARNLDIVAIDATNPFGNGHVIPRGTLREPLAGLKRADLFVLAKSDLGAGNLPVIKEALAKINPSAEVVEAVHRPLALIEFGSGKKYDLTFLNGKDIGIFCAIADPASFERMLAQQNCNIAFKKIFVDHYSYGRNDILGILDLCREKNADILMTTEKDAVKLTNLIGAADLKEIKIVSLRIAVEITKGKEKLIERINHLSLR